MTGNLIPAGPALAAWMESWLCELSDRTAPLPERVGQQRPPIPGDVYRAVKLRDGSQCQICPSSTRRVGDLRPQLDHIVPWISGGADHPVNLRVTYRACNQRRSNRWTGNERRAGLVVTRCRSCDRRDAGSAAVVDAFCMTCRETRPAYYVLDVLVGGPIPGSGVPALPRGESEPLLIQRPLGLQVSSVLTVRFRAQQVTCPWCSAAAGEPCAGLYGPLTRTPAHASRIDLAGAA